MNKDPKAPGPTPLICSVDYHGNSQLASNLTAVSTRGSFVMCLFTFQFYSMISFFFYIFLCGSSVLRAVAPHYAPTTEPGKGDRGKWGVMLCCGGITTV